MANTLNLGNGNWGVKKDSLLAYNSENGNFKPLPFDFTRASSATVVNKDGLIETVGGGEPRIDFSNDAKGALLLEPSRSNLITYSEDFSQSGWQKQSAGVASAPIVTSNYAISPDGTLNADRVVFDINGGTTSSDFSQIADAITNSIGDVTNSIWIKSNTTSNYNISFVDPDANYTSIVVTTEWRRFDVTSTTSSTASALRLRLRGSEATSDSADVSVWGAQVEQGSYATSYIPTQGSAVTRVADACNNGGNAQVINSTEGVLYAEINYQNIQPNWTGFGLTDGNNPANRIVFATQLNTKNFKIYFQSGGTVRWNPNFVLNQINQYYKIAISYKANDLSLWINGVKVASDNTVSIMPIGLDSLGFFGYSNLEPTFGKTKDVRVYTTALSDSELQALTK